jgi:hypothetical protein
MTAFTARQQEIITKTRQLIPENWSANLQDEKILMYAETVLADINVFPPLQNYTTETVPDTILPILYFGVALFAELFMQCRLSLEEFQYNDNGLSVSTNFVANIGASYANLLETYRHMITNYKKTQIFAVGGLGLGSPRYQSQIGQFLKLALGSAFTWNTP